MYNVALLPRILDAYLERNISENQTPLKQNNQIIPKSSNKQIRIDLKTGKMEVIVRETI